MKRWLVDYRKKIMIGIGKILSLKTGKVLIHLLIDAFFLYENIFHFYVQVMIQVATIKCQRIMIIASLRRISEISMTIRLFYHAIEAKRSRLLLLM